MLNMAARGMPALRGRPSIQTARGGAIRGSPKTTPTKMGNGRGNLTARGTANSRLISSSRGRGVASTSARLNMARGGGRGSSRGVSSRGVSARGSPLTRGRGSGVPAGRGVEIARSGKVNVGQAGLGRSVPGQMASRPGLLLSFCLLLL